MKTSLLLLLVSIRLCAQDSLPEPPPVAHLADSLTVPVPTAGDTVNVTDSLGLKQGHWIFFGGDFPNSGVDTYDILEEGTYENNERTGTWYRYGANRQLKAVMLFHIDPKTKLSVRDQFYNYTYYTNGNLKRKPVIGACRTMSDYFIYTEKGPLQEAELFDHNCNTTYRIQQIKEGELDSVSILIVDGTFREQPEAQIPPMNTISFDQTGEYYVDYGHTTFQVGHFENGKFVTGREYLFDEMMRAQRVRYYVGGTLVRTVVR